MRAQTCGNRDELGSSGRLGAGWNTSMAKDLPGSPNSYGAKGVKSGAWWNSSWGKPAWDA